MCFTDANVTHEHIYDSNDELMSALNLKDIDAALVLCPLLERELAAHPQKLDEAQLVMPHADWNIVALYPVGPRSSVVQKFNAGIEALKKSGKMAQIVSLDSVSRTHN